MSLSPWRIIGAREPSWHGNDWEGYRLRKKPTDHNPWVFSWDAHSLGSLVRVILGAEYEDLRYLRLVAFALKNRSQSELIRAEFSTSADGTTSIDLVHD
jgi:hypothetical protein